MSETVNTETYQPQSSGGGCGKVLLWLFIIALILSCLCCAGLFGLGYHVATAFKNGLVMDPAVAQTKAVEAFGELNLPEVIKPRAFFNLKLFGQDFGFASLYSWKTETAAEAPAEESESPKEDNDLDDVKDFVAFYSLADALKSHETEIVQGISQALSDQKKAKNYTIKKTENVTVTINGKPNEFTISLLENDDKDIYTMASGAFGSKTGNQCGVVIYRSGEVQTEEFVNVLQNLQ